MGSVPGFAPSAQTKHLETEHSDHLDYLLHQPQPTRSSPNPQQRIIGWLLACRPLALQQNVNAEPLNDSNTLEQHKVIFHCNIDSLLPKGRLWLNPGLHVSFGTGWGLGLASWGLQGPVKVSRKGFRAFGPSNKFKKLRLPSGW